MSTSLFWASRGKACFSALMTGSVTIRPKLTACDETAVAVRKKLSEILGVGPASAESVAFYTAWTQWHKRLLGKTGGGRKRVAGKISANSCANPIHGINVNGE